MSLKTATVIGGTGLIGSHLITLLQQQTGVETIRVLVRRPVQFREPKAVVKLVNFNDDESFKLAIEGSDAVFCAVGTTQKKVKGDKAAYRKVDYNIPVNAARFCAETGCDKFLLVSSVGANKESRNFYLQLKGEVEDAIQQFPIQSLSIFQPSFLLGKRSENRVGEKIGQIFMQVLSFLFVGALRKYKPVQASDVARAMIEAATKGETGCRVYQFPHPL